MAYRTYGIVRSYFFCSYVSDVVSLIGGAAVKKILSLIMVTFICISAVFPAYADIQTIPTERQKRAAGHVQSVVLHVGRPFFPAVSSSVSIGGIRRRSSRCPASKRKKSCPYGQSPADPRKSRVLQVSRILHRESEPSVP